MGEHKLPPKQTSFLRQFLRLPPGVPTKQRFDPPPPKEIMPNYVRRAVGLWGRRIILSPETQVMMMELAARQTIRTLEADKPTIVLDSCTTIDLHEHQSRALDSLQEVNSTVTIVLPEDAGKSTQLTQE